MKNQAECKSIKTTLILSTFWWLSVPTGARASGAPAPSLPGAAPPPLTWDSGRSIFRPPADTRTRTIQLTFIRRLLFAKLLTLVGSRNARKPWACLCPLKEKLSPLYIPSLPSLQVLLMPSAGTSTRSQPSLNRQASGKRPRRWRGPSRRAVATVTRHSVGVPYSPSPRLERR